MADTKISALTAATSMALTDELIINNAGTSKKIDFSNLTETGTFTPTIYGSTTAGTNTYDVKNGHYTRTGKLVHFSIYLDTSAIDAALAGAIRVGGLPYTSAASIYTPVSVAWMAGISMQSSYMLTAYIEASNTYINLTETNGATKANITDADLAANTQIMLSGCYQSA